MEHTSDPQPKTGNRTILIGVIVTVVICCCCAFTAVGGYYGWQAYQAKQALDYQQEYTPPTLAPEDFQPTQPVQEPAPSNEPPMGGNTDDILRNDIWSVLSGAASGMGCTPNGSASSIEMIQAPDSTGTWAEKWTVSCTDGSSMAFNVTFVPDPSGGTNYSIDQVK